MFSMCSELTPRARIPDTRIPQLMQPCGQVYRAQRRSCSNTGWVEKASILLALASLAQVNLERLGQFMTVWKLWQCWRFVVLVSSLPWWWLPLILTTFAMLAPYLPCRLVKGYNAFLMISNNSKKLIWLFSFSLVLCLHLLFTLVTMSTPTHR